MPEFVIDSGNGGHHVVSEIDLIESPVPINDFIMTASGERLPATAKGDLNAIYPGTAVHVPLATANKHTQRERTHQTRLGSSLRRQQRNHHHARGRDTTDYCL